MASKRGLHQLDVNQDNFVSDVELLNNFEKDNKFTATIGEKKIAEIITKEADFNQDGNMTVGELYGLVLGQNSQRDISGRTGIEIGLFSFKFRLM